MVLCLYVAKCDHIQHCLERVYIRVTHHAAQVDSMQCMPVNEGAGGSEAEGQRWAPDSAAASLAGPQPQLDSLLLA